MSSGKTCTWKRYVYAATKLYAATKDDIQGYQSLLGALFVVCLHDSTRFRSSGGKVYVVDMLLTSLLLMT